MGEKQGLLLESQSALMHQILEQVREELDDHRSAINDTTTEVQANTGLIAVIEQRLDALSARLDELMRLVKGEKSHPVFEFTPLTAKEKEVFVGLYNASEGRKWVSYKQLASVLNMSEQLVAAYITHLLEKGIPVQKRMDKGVVYMMLHEGFRELQTKENIVGINSTLSAWVGH